MHVSWSTKHDLKICDNPSNLNNCKIILQITATHLQNAFVGWRRDTHTHTSGDPCTQIQQSIHELYVGILYVEYWPLFKLVCKIVLHVFRLDGKNGKYLLYSPSVNFHQTFF